VVAPVARLWAEPEALEHMAAAAAAVVLDQLEVLAARAATVS
jgi:hypothetical protein